MKDLIKQILPLLRQLLILLLKKTQAFLEAFDKAKTP